MNTKLNKHKTMEKLNTQEKAENNTLLCDVQIEVFDLYPMERREKYKRYQAELIHFKPQTNFLDDENPKNKKIIRKTEYDAVKMGKIWKKNLVEKEGLNVRVRGVYVLD